MTINKLSLLIVLVSGVLLSGCTTPPLSRNNQIVPTSEVGVTSDQFTDKPGVVQESSSTDESDLLKLLESESLPDLDTQIKELEAELQ